MMRLIMIIMITIIGDHLLSSSRFSSPTFSEHFRNRWCHLATFGSTVNWGRWCMRATWSKCWRHDQTSATSVMWRPRIQRNGWSTKRHGFFNPTKIHGMFTTYQLVLRISLAQFSVSHRYLDQLWAISGWWWLEPWNFESLSHHIGNVIIPKSEVHHFSGVGFFPPTNFMAHVGNDEVHPGRSTRSGDPNHWNLNMAQSKVRWFTHEKWWILP